MARRGPRFGRAGLRAFGASKPTQVMVWEQLMGAKTRGGCDRSDADAIQDPNTALAGCGRQFGFEYHPGRSGIPVDRIWAI